MLRSYLKIAGVFNGFSYKNHHGKTWWFFYIRRPLVSQNDLNGLLLSGLINHFRTFQDYQASDKSPVVGNAQQDCNMK